MNTVFQMIKTVRKETLNKTPEHLVTLSN